MHLGKHVIIDLYNCPYDLLDDILFCRNTLVESVRIGEGTLISDSFKKFEPFGVSGMVIIAESHVSIHTWPERGFAALDIFTCGEMKINDMQEFLAKSFSAKFMIPTAIQRGNFIGE